VDENLSLVPHSMISSRDKRSCWQQASKPNLHSMFCHLDLAQHNIFIDPVTFEITDIIDWEYAGFFPVEFELQRWLRP
jgi:thiamine kinase-like enzyme